MKTLVTLLLLALSALSPARDVTFAWDANPASDGVTSYRLEMMNAQEAWIPIGTVAGDITTLRAPTFPDVATNIRAFAINSFGESDPSPPLLIGVKPGTVQGLKVAVTIKVTVEP